MTTIRQAAERLYESRTLVRQSTGLKIGDLHRRFMPPQRGSLRALIPAMLDGVSKRQPWAIILCRFKGAPVNSAVEDPVKRFYEEIFTPGAGGLIEYWRDASLGAIDVTGSRVFGWVEIDIARADAGGSNKTTPPGPGREGLIDAAIRAILRDDERRLDGFHSQIGVFTENWSKDGVTQDGDWEVWGDFWIDGSADGRGKVVSTPPDSGQFIAHEMGHGFGMGHDLASDFKTEYADPCCIMSQNPLFVHPRWNVWFGPVVCLPHLIQQGWMYERRLFRADRAWMTTGDGITLPLAPTNDPHTRANLGIVLPFETGGGNWDYYVEYARSTEWNRGLSSNFVFIRRIGQKNGRLLPTILGSIEVPKTIGQSSSFVEPSGNVQFTVEPTDTRGRVLKVNVRRL